MTVYVYNEDTYQDDGGYKLTRFASREEACAFVKMRMAKSKRRTLEMYKLIEGVELTLKVTEVVSKLEAE